MIVVGAHVSTADRLYKAAERARAIGADCAQIFFGAPVAWAQPRYSAQEIAEYRRRSLELSVSPTFIHAAYVINLATHDARLRARSTSNLAATLRFGEKLQAAGVVLHPGSHQGRGFSTALPVVADGIRRVLDEAPGDCPLLLECSAGGGGSVGRSFEELAAILDAAGRRSRLGVCLDLAHLHGAGFDIVTRAGVDRTMAAFGRVVGWDRLRLVHANDSKVERGSLTDRHQNIGRGTIGSSGFKRLLAKRQLTSVPWVLEVPGENREGPDRPNLLRLRRLSRSVAGSRRPR